MASVGTHGSKCTALFIVLLLAGQEAAAFRRASRTVSRHDSESTDNLDVKEGTKSRDLWQQLKSVASSRNETIRCGASARGMLEAAYLTITSTMNEMAGKCEQAKSGGQGKCMFRGSGESPTALIRKAFRFHSVTNKLADCSWMKQFAAEHKSTNEAVGLDLDRIFKTAPEFASHRGNSKVDFAAFTRSMTKLDRSDITIEEVQEGTMEAFGHGFGTDRLGDALDTFEQGNIDDVANVSPVPELDNLIETLQPEYCYRQWRWFGANGGCSRGGNFGSESCFMFNAGSYSSEDSKHQDDLPESSVNAANDIVLTPALDSSERQAGGFKKSSWNTWGVCLPRNDPKSKLDKINGDRSKALKKETEFGNNSTGSSLIQADSHMLASTQIIGVLVQIPIAILMSVLQFVAALVMFPLFLVQLATTLLMVPVALIPILGRIVAFLITLPVCLISMVLAGIFSVAYQLLDIAYQVAGMIGIGGDLSSTNKTVGMVAMGVANCVSPLAFLGFASGGESSESSE